MTASRFPGSIEVTMTVLYRQYRPSQFSHVLGQDHVRGPLVNALTQDKIGHAYIFSGPRGTGKTTVARLFAKAANCSARSSSGEACGQCPSCLLITQNQSLDILEIDAASNRGIDEIRELRDTIAFAPTAAVYKVYIIDEVHMLTKDAFNALLKTLEEPPKHAIFILATTELHRVPETIISRCQRFHFHRAAEAALDQLLLSVATAEQWQIDPAALALVRERADGSYRDALTLLSNLATLAQPVTVEQAEKTLGLPPHQLVADLLAAIRIGDRAAMAKLIITVRGQGLDLGVFVKAVSDLIARQLIDGAAPIEPRLVMILEELLSVLARSRVSPNPEALLVARILSLGDSTQPASPPPAELPKPTIQDLQKSPADSNDEGPLAVDAVSAIEPETVPPTAVANQFWPAFLAAVKEHNHALYAVVRAAELDEVTVDKVLINVQFRFYAERLYEAKNRKLIETIAAQVAGRPLRLECQVKPELKKAVAVAAPDALATVVEVFELEED